MAPNSKWCDLPPELLEVVAKLLDDGESHPDTRYMRSVCSSWRFAVPPPRPVQFPAPIKFLVNSSNSEIHHFDLRLAKHTFLHLSKAPQHSAGWLIKIEEHKPGIFHLFNPFSRTKITRNKKPFMKLDVTNFKIRELGYEYVLHNHNAVNGFGDMQDLYNMEHEKVALIKLPTYNCQSSTTIVSNNDYAILSTHNTGKLLLYQSILKEWSFLDYFSTLGYDDRSIFVNDWSLHYVDVVEYEGTFYAVTNSGRTVAINLVSSTSVAVNLLTKSIIGGDKKYLVKSADDLLMVDLYTCPTLGARLVEVHAVEIFKLDKQQQTWVLVKTLGDRALFLSNHSCFSASISVLPDSCKPNSVYFYFENFDRKKGNEDDIDCDQFVWSRDEIGVFDFEKGILGSLEEYLQNSQHFSWQLPAWVISRTT